MTDDTKQTWPISSKSMIIFLSAIGLAFGGGTFVPNGTTQATVDVDLAASVARIESKLDGISSRLDSVAEHVSSVDDDLTALRIKVAPLFGTDIE